MKLDATCSLPYCFEDRYKKSNLLASPELGGAPTQGVRQISLKMAEAASLPHMVGDLMVIKLLCKGTFSEVYLVRLNVCCVSV